MMDEDLNKSIKCDVENCANHNKEGFCSLDSIQISSNEDNPKIEGQVDCTDFVNDEDN